MSKTILTIRPGGPIARYATLAESGTEGEKETMERDQGKNLSSDDEDLYPPPPPTKKSTEG